MLDREKEAVLHILFNSVSNGLKKSKIIFANSSTSKRGLVLPNLLQNNILFSKSVISATRDYVQ
jgi:hypothetical protein